MPFVLNDADNTIEFGKILATAMSASPVRALYLYADLGGGKTTLTRGFVSALPGGERAEVASPSFTLCNVYPTRPEIVHADLYRLSEGASMPEEMEELLEDGNALLVLEWPEYLAPQYRDAERLEVRLIHSEKITEKSDEIPEPMKALKTLDNACESCKSFRLATLEAHGIAAQALLNALLPELKKRFLSEQA